MRRVRAAVVPVVIAALAAGVTAIVTGTIAAGPVGASPTPDGGYVAIAPVRLLDTRNGTGTTAGAVAPGGTVTLQVGGSGVIPGSIAAVALNVTATGATAPSGFVTVWNDDAVKRPATSNLNLVRGATEANSVITPVGADGGIKLYNGSAGTVQLIADVFGYDVEGGGAPTDPGTFSAVTPSRLLDTRNGTGAAKGAVLGGHQVALKVTTNAFPNVTAVVLNVTATAGTGGGYVTVWADGGARPTTSNVNYVKGQTVPNLVIVPVGTDGKVDFYNGSAGSVQIVADVSGYFLAVPSTPITDPGALQPLAPARLLDTRSGTGAPKALLAGKGSVTVQVTGRGGVPSSGVSAVVLNVTVTGATGSGYITAFADGAARPTTSNVNFVKGQVVPNLVIAPVGADGRVVLAAQGSGSLELVADVFGYVLGTPSPTWNPQQAAIPTDASASPGSAFTDVQCPSAGSCFAVGSYQSATNGAMVQTLAGGVWTKSETPLPTDPSAHVSGQAALLSISCTGAGACVAVGSVTDSNAANSGNGMIEAIVGGAQTTATVAPLPAGSSTNPDAGLEGVSCAAAGACVAVGSYTDTTTNSQGLIDVLASGSWSAVKAAVPPNAATNPKSSLSSIACPTSTDCVAIGSYTDSNNVVQGMVDVLASGSWTAQETLLPSNASTTLADPELTAISCPAVGTCEIVGDYFDTNGADRILIESMASATVTVVQGAPLGAAANDVDAELSGVSCTAIGACIAVGFTAVGVNGVGVIETLTGTNWAETHAPLPTNADSTVSFLTTVTCPAAGACTAVGGYVDGINRLQADVLTLAGGVWSPVTAPLPPNNVVATDNAELDAVACTADSTTCAAVGWYPTTTNSTTGLLESFLS